MILGFFLHLLKGLETTSDPCEKNDNLCNNGRCRHIPFTSQYICQCERYYDGETCDEVISPATDVKMIEYISTLRRSSIAVSGDSGVPDIIDVSYAISDLQERLNRLEKNIVDSINHAEIVSIGGGIWEKITYIVSQVQELKLKKIDDTIFYHRCASRDFHYILSSFFQLITGSVFAQRTDFMTSFKKMVASSLGDGYACLEEYTNMTRDMRSQIVSIDKIVTEAWMTVMRVNASRLARSEQVNCLKHSAIFPF